MNEELYLNGIRVELPIRSVARTLQINDIAEVKDRQANFSNSIKIARTPNNIIAFDTIGVTGTNSKFPYQEVSVKYILEGIELVSNGKGVLKSTTKGYNLIIYDGNISMSDLLGDKKVSELDFSAYNHNLTQSLYTSSYTNTSGYIYGLGKFYENASTNLIDIDLQGVSFYVHTLFEMIFIQNGWSVSGDILTDINFINRVTSTAIGYDRTIIDNRALEYTRDNNFDPQINESFGSTLTTKEYLIDTYVSSSSSTHEVNVNGEVDIRNGKDASIVLKINSVEFDRLNITDSNSFNHSFYFSADLSDNIQIYVEVTSVDVVGVQTITFNTEYITNIFDNDRYIEIDFSTLFGDLKQIDFVKEVMQRWGLSFTTDNLNKDFEFKQWKVLLEDYSNAENWSDKYSEFVGERYKPSYARVNTMKYKYTDSEDSYADGQFEVDNVNLSNTKDLFTSIFKASSQSTNPLFYNLTQWKDSSDEVVSNNDGIRIFKITLLNDVIDYRFSGDVVGNSTFSGIVPYLDFNTISYNDEINYSYLQLKSLLDTYKYYTLKIKLNVLDIYNLDFFKLKFIKQLGGYFYINKVSNFKNNKVTTVELVKVGEKVVDRLALEGESNGLSIVSGDLTKLTNEQLQGTSNGVSSVSGELSIETSLNSFITNTTGTSSGFACSRTLDITRYHDGASYDPVIADFIYEDSSGVTLFNGGGDWYKVGISDKIQIDSLGEVTDKQTC